MNANAIVMAIRSAAEAMRLPPELVLAVCRVESSLNPWAYNPEPGYRWVVDCRTGRPFRALTPAERTSAEPPPDFPMLAGDRDQEWWGQRASWGLMQIMGALAREIGFRGPYLPELCDPMLNLSLGCRHLSRLRDRYLPTRGWHGVCAVYNGGPGALLADGNVTNPAYPAKVLLALGGRWPDGGPAHAA